MEGFISRGFISVDDEPRPLLQSKRIEDKMLNPESRLSYPPRAFPVAISSATDNSRVRSSTFVINTAIYPRIIRNDQAGSWTKAPSPCVYSARYRSQLIS